MTGLQVTWGRYRVLVHCSNDPTPVLQPPGLRSGYRDQTLMAILANEVTLRLSANFTIAMLIEVSLGGCELILHVDRLKIVGSHT